MPQLHVTSSTELPQAVRIAIQSVKKYIDRLIGRGVSTGRPVTPSIGDRFTETDTFRELMWDGTGWVIMSEPTQSYVPAWTNLTLGAGQNLGTYHRSDGYCDFTTIWTLGAGGAVGTGPTISIPVALSSGIEFETDVSVLFYVSASGARFYGHTYAVTTTTVGLLAEAASGAYVAGASATALIPFTFAAGDTIEVSGRYRMANRYT